MNPAANPPHYPWQDDPFQWHPYAEMFPMMNDSELEELIADIDLYDQKNPVQIYDGKILDGRNRYLALELLNERRFKEGKPLVKLIYGTFAADVTPENDASALSFVKSHNLTRRNLTTSQRAAIAVELKRHYEEIAKRAVEWEKNNPKSSRVNSHEPSFMRRSDFKAAQDTGVGQQSVSRADTIAKSDPELFKGLINGEISVNAAYNQVKGKATTKKEPEPDPIDDDETESDSKIIEISEDDIITAFVSNLGFLSPAQVQFCLKAIYDSRKSDLIDFLSQLRMIEPSLFTE